MMPLTTIPLTASKLQPVIVFIAVAPWSSSTPSPLIRLRRVSDRVPGARSRRMPKPWEPA